MVGPVRLRPRGRAHRPVPRMGDRPGPAGPARSRPLDARPSRHLLQLALSSVRPIPTQGRTPMSLLRRLGPLLMLTLSLAPPAPAPAKDCPPSAPLPDDVRLRAPAPDVPADVARCAGAWSGVWLDPGGEKVLCQTLIVEEVFPNGYARIVHSRGSHPGWNLSHPTSWRATGHVSAQVLRFALPTPDRVELTYRFDGDTLASTVSDRQGSHGTLTRLDEMSRVECGRTERRPRVPPAAATRDRLTAAELLAPSLPPHGPVHNDYFRPIGTWGAAKHTLAGTLTIGTAPISASSEGCPSLPTPSQAVTLEFFTAGEHLVPVVRDFVPPAGRLIVSPGRVWSEPGDGGMSRASFPFILVNPVHNGAHNGVATFLFDDTHVSGLRVQVVQETSSWERLDFWGHLPLTHAPGPIANAAALPAAFPEELRRQTPMQPWPALPATAALAAFDGDPAPTDISANGLVVDGVLYVRGCNNRDGPFPYCREMRHGVFSVTKSLGAAVALLRLAQKYGDAVLDEK